MTATKYRLVAHPDRGTFASAMEAVLFALSNNLNGDWEAVIA